MASTSPPRPAVDATAAMAAEVRRERHALVIGGAFALGAAGLMQLVDTTTRLHWIATAACALGALLCFVVARRIRPGTPIGHTQQLVAGGVLTFVALVCLAYLGPFSAVVAVLPLLVFYCGFSDNDLKAWTVYAGAASGYLAISVACFRGTIVATRTPLAMITDREGYLVVSLVVQAVLAASFYLGRHNRALLLRTIEEVGQVASELRHNKVELVHARAQGSEEAVFGKLSGLCVGGYQLGGRIGRGGMGEVYRALGEDDQPAAVKVLTESMRDDPVQVERFFREAQVSSELDSPHIVKIVDQGWSPDGRYPYLAMELLMGRDLGSHLRATGPLSLRETVDLVCQVAEALSCAHAVGIVHRDMKPENVFRCDTEQGVIWKVLDFGISKMTASEGTLTQNGVIGTPNYMSPEQAVGGSVDARADVFALGAITYRVLTGRLAFDAQEPLAALMQVMNDMPVDPLEYADLPEDVADVVALAMAKDKTERFGSALELAEAFRAAARSALSDDLRRAAAALLARRPWTGTDSIRTDARDLLAPAAPLTPPSPIALPHPRAGRHPTGRPSAEPATAALPSAYLPPPPSPPSPSAWPAASVSSLPPPRASHTRVRPPLPAPSPRRAPSDEGSDDTMQLDVFG
ncbi:MAG: serine/threonine-protein kinase [Polyangiaceae bacterium]